MISCYLQGGLGNQMFQIAATYALAKRNNDTCGFDFEKCNTPLQGYKSTKYQQTLFRNITNINGFKSLKIYSEPKFSYDFIPYSQNLLLMGYFQSELYFKDYEDEIKNLFYFEDENIKKVQEYISSINLSNLSVTVIHIRRGDYLLNPDFHPTCSKEYFDKGIDIIENSCYIFVSDDLNWAKENFVGGNFFYFESGDEILDLTLMVLADNLIISNSSFSWWGAYLNKNKTKKVIVPNTWFGVKGPKDTNTLIPDNWLKI
jgi:hypothetical protein